MTDKTSGSAFPLPATEWHGADEGMTLRDYFAAKSMQGDWSCQSGDSGYFIDCVNDDAIDKAAELYYRMADAMLRAREK